MNRYCAVRFIRYYVAVPDKRDSAYAGTKRYLAHISRHATVMAKAMKYIPIGGRVAKKGNVDIEITLDVVRNLGDLDVVFIVSGDSDFYELKKYVVDEKGKRLVFLGYEENMAWELRQCRHIYFNRIRKTIELT